MPVYLQKRQRSEVRSTKTHLRISWWFKISNFRYFSSYNEGHHAEHGEIAYLSDQFTGAATSSTVYYRNIWWERGKIGFWLKWSDLRLLWLLLFLCLAKYQPVSWQVKLTILIIMDGGDIWWLIWWHDYDDTMLWMRSWVKWNWEWQQEWVQVRHPRDSQLRGRDGGDRQPGRSGKRWDLWRRGDNDDDDDHNEDDNWQYRRFWQRFWIQGERGGWSVGRPPWTKVVPLHEGSPHPWCWLMWPLALNLVFTVDKIYFETPMVPSWFFLSASCRCQRHQISLGYPTYHASPKPVAVYQNCGCQMVPDTIWLPT